MRSQSAHGQRKQDGDGGSDWRISRVRVTHRRGTVRDDRHDLNGYFICLSPTRLVFVILIRTVHLCILCMSHITNVSHDTFLSPVLPCTPHHPLRTTRNLSHQSFLRGSSIIDFFLDFPRSRRSCRKTRCRPRSLVVQVFGTSSSYGPHELLTVFVSPPLGLYCSVLIPTPRKSE